MNLKEARRSAGLTLQQTADALGVTPATIHGWEHGKNAPMVTRLPKLAETYGLSINDVVNCYQETLEQKGGNR